MENCRVERFPILLHMFEPSNMAQVDAAATGRSRSRSRSWKCSSDCWRYEFLKAVKVAISRVSDLSSVDSSCGGHWISGTHCQAIFYLFVVEKWFRFHGTMLHSLYIVLDFYGKPASRIQEEVFIACRHVPEPVITAHHLKGELLPNSECKSMQANLCATLAYGAHFSGLSLRSRCQYLCIRIALYINEIC